MDFFKLFSISQSWSSNITNTKKILLPPTHQTEEWTPWFRSQGVPSIVTLQNAYQHFYLPKNNHIDLSAPSSSLKASFSFPSLPNLMTILILPCFTQPARSRTLALVQPHLFSVADNPCLLFCPPINLFLPLGYFSDVFWHVGIPFAQQVISLNSHCPLSQMSLGY